MSQPMKSTGKNGFEVSQNRILYLFCYKMCTPLELRDQIGQSGHYGTSNTGWIILHASIP